MESKILTLVILFSAFIYAQDRVSSGSYSMFKSNGFDSSNERGNLNERMIIVEDFINYHKHKIQIPSDSTPTLSIDYDNSIEDDKIILQIGLATPLKEHIVKSEEEVSISLVIDESGSMSGDKMKFVKEAIKTFVKGLDNGVTISIVTFSSDTQTILNPLKIANDRSMIYKIIDNIQPSGSTNINAGMIQGYDEIMKSHKNGMNSRLILLTDGMTNTGETDFEKILTNSKKYNSKGIEISTVGVGQSIDFDLLRSLAENGRGSNYFIGELEQDIQKVFITELESLLYNVGKESKIRVKLPKNFSIEKIYGYKPHFVSKNEVSISLENMNINSTQIILMEVECENCANDNLEVELNYLKDKKTQIVKNSINYKSNNTKLTNDEIVKNYSIALMSDALKEYADEFIKGNQPNKNQIKNTIHFTEKYTNTKDIDIKRIYDLLNDLI